MVKDNAGKIFDDRRKEQRRKETIDVNLDRRKNERRAETKKIKKW